MRSGIQKPSRSRRRTRRIIWNNDGDDMRVTAFGAARLWNARDKDGTVLPERFTSVDEFLQLRMSALCESPVDTISYCGVFNWPVWDIPRERIAVLGDDPLVPVIDFTHRCGKDFFFNVRMNDCHVSGPYYQGPLWWEPFRMSHRNCLHAQISDEMWERVYLPWARGDAKVYPLQDVLDRRGPGNPDTQSWAAYDYSRSEVREYFLGLIKKACQRYDIDGIDLDWLRSPFFLRFGEERRHIPLMNDFVKRAAAVVRQAAQKRGRPIALCMRVPDSPVRALEIGLDVGRWISERWLDILVAGNGLSVYSMPLKPWQSLCNAQGIPVYGCITRSAPGLGEPEAFYGACQRMWRNNVDGLYFFNHFIPSEYDTMRQGADPKTLRGMTKSYGLDRQFTSFENATVHEGPLPMVFSGCREDAAVDFVIEIPETLKPADDLVLLVQWRGGYHGHGSRWSVNGKASRARSGREDCLVYNVSGLQTGANVLHLDVPSTVMRRHERIVLEAVRVRVGRGVPGDPKEFRGRHT